MVNNNNRAPNKDFDSDVEDIAFDNNMIERVSPQDFDCDIITPRDNNMDTARGLLQETQSPRDELIQQKDQEIEQIVTPEPHMKLFDP